MMPDGTPDINDIAKAAKAGSELSRSIGDLFPGYALRSVSKAEGKVTDRILEDLRKIKASQEVLGLSEDSISELMGNAVRRHSRNVNFDAVLTFAKPMVNNEADFSGVNREWAEDFRDHAEKAFDDEVRRVWASILAGEINEPGTFSKRTLSILSDMSMSEVESFKRLCSCCLRVANGLLPVLSLDESNRSYNNGSFSIRDEAILSSLGLVDSSKDAGFDVAPNESCTFFIHGIKVRAHNASGSTKRFSSMPAVTIYGTELSLLCDSDIGTLDGLDKLFVRKLEQSGFRAEIQLDEMHEQRA